MNKYLPFYGLQLNVGTEAGTFSTNMAPAARIVTSANRAWNDGNRNFVPDCDLINPVANGECGAMTPSNFGSTASGVTYDPDIVEGWNKRAYDWQFSTGVQHELMPNVSVDVGYFRTFFGNHFVTDNRAWERGDFDRFTIPAPVDERLPGGGGYPVEGLYNVRPDRFSVPADNYITFSKNYGKETQRWDGLDVTFNARPRPGLSFQGGTSTGKTTLDNCDIVDDMPELLIRLNLPEASCHRTTKFLTDFKVLGSYTVPVVDMQVAATLQSIPGAEIAANYVATNAVIAPALGRPLSGNAANMTVNIVEPGTMYGDRSTQVQLRVSKLLRFKGTRTIASLDIYNLLNSNTVMTQNNAYAAWLRPQSIPNPRWAKIVLQYDF
jgi:hypothetical protein